ncbi:MAG: hypothetical protein WAU60_00550 [Candidatus Competibacter denitrificans]|jgi:hypothetical protein
MSETQLKSIYRFGGWISLIVAAGFFFIGILVAFDPAERLRGEAIFKAFAEQPTIPLVWRYIFVAIGILSVAVINALSRYVRRPGDEHWEGIVQFFTITALAGTVLSALDWMREIIGISLLAKAHIAGDLAAITALKMDSYLSFDPNFVWKFGILGFFYLLISLLAWRNRSLPQSLAAWGILTGVLLNLAMLFGMTDTVIPIGGGQIAAMQIPAAIGGSICGPVFHFWLGLLLIRAGAIDGLSSNQNATHQEPVHAH